MRGPRRLKTTNNSIIRTCGDYSSNRGRGITDKALVSRTTN
jgi:hypothetical protein